MKLAFVSIVGAPWGGSEMLWTKAASLALKKKHEVLVSVFEWPQQSAAVLDLQKQNAKIVFRRRYYPALPMRIRKKLLNVFLPAGKKTTYHDYLLRFKSDCIFFSLGGGLEIAEDESDLMLFVRQTMIPFYIFFHAYSPDEEIRESVKSNAVESFAKAKQVFFTSRLQLESLEKKLGRTFSNFAVLNHPLSFRFGEPLPYPSAPVIQIAMIGSLIVRWKGQDKAIRILSRSKWRDRDWMLNIYGAGEDRELLADLIQRNGMQDKVFLQGNKDPLPAIWKKNHVLLIASHTMDSGPITLFEAMNAGRPVVSTYIGAAPEYVQSNVTGILANGRAEDDLEEALEQAWLQKEKWAEWGLNARAFLQTRYDFDAAQTLLNILSAGA